MDTIGSLLTGRAPREPDEVRIIKAYVRAEFDREVHVVVREHGEISIIAASAALSNAVRLRLHALKGLVGDDRRISVRIGKPA